MYQIINISLLPFSDMVLVNEPVIAETFSQQNTLEAITRSSIKRPNIKSIHK